MSVKLRWRKRKKGKRAYLDIYNGVNNRYSKFLPIDILISDSLETKKDKLLQAETYQSKMQLELASNDTGILPEHKKAIELLNYLDIVIKRYKNKDIRKLEGLKIHLKLHIEKKSFKLKSVDLRFCESFMDYLTKRSDLSKETAHNYWTKFKYVLSEAIKEGYIKESPARNIRFKGATNFSTDLKKQILNAEELKKLRAAYCGNEDVKDAFMFACFTGLGAAELRDLKTSNVKNDQLDTRRKKNGQRVLNDLPKQAIEIASKRKNQEYLFKLPSDTAINKLLKNWIEKAEVDKHITFYCARHTYAVLLLNNGANLKTVADLMGHASTQHTLKYLKYTDELKKEAVAKLDRIQI